MLLFGMPACASASALATAETLARFRSLANEGRSPYAEDRRALLAEADRDWRWGSLSGRMTTTLGLSGKACHPGDAPDQTRYLRNGASDALAMVIAYLVAEQPKPEHATQARDRVLELVQTSGYVGLLEVDYSGGNQCILELAISLPVWIETAELLASTPFWKASHEAAFARWLAEHAYPKVAWASRVRRNNWGAAGSAAASAIARYVDGKIEILREHAPSARALPPAEAASEHDAMQLARIGTEWRGDGECARVGIQAHGGIPDELRRGAAGCEGSFIPSEDDPGRAYQTMHVEHMLLHAESLRVRGDTSLFEAKATTGAPALLQAILFVIDNPTKDGSSWPWGDRTGALRIAERYYGDARLTAELERSDVGFRGGRSLPYTRILLGRPAPPALLLGP